MRIGVDVKQSQGQDNLALHEEVDFTTNSKAQILDRVGFILPTKADVDEFYKKALAKKIPIAKDIKLHRDGAYSFY